MMEAFVVFVRNDIAIANIGKEMGPTFAPLIMSFFFFILMMNLLGLMPWGASPTGNLAVTAALAIISFLVIEIGGMMKLGVKGYMGTDLPARRRAARPRRGGDDAGHGARSNCSGKLVKPIALAIRLFGNMLAGHFVILSLFGLIFMFGGLGRGASASVSPPRAGGGQ